MITKQGKRGATMAQNKTWGIALCAIGWMALEGCADPCVDDGLQQDGKDPACPGLLSLDDTAGDESTTTEMPIDSTGPGPASCDNGIQDGDETDIDCGGSCEDTCGDGQGCGTGADCMSGVCEDGVCLPPACQDGVLNGEETDIDCGGPVCMPCDDGEDCVIDTDCTSSVCGEGNTCEPPTCEDGVQNGDETDVDCGGPMCVPCDDGEMCMDDDDCVSGMCVDGTCVSVTCRDGVQNGDETDIDCGGDTCPGCDDGEMCMEDEDCMSGTCDPITNTCTSISCTDGVQNGDETDVDCGGGTCPGCDDGEMCIENGDCQSQVCDPGTNTCTPPTCTDGVQNGDETDEDCGNTCGPTCDTGEGCDDGADCISAVCDPLTLTCDAPTCMDGVQNGDETDEDCGNTCGPTCDTGEGCDDGADCISSVCDPLTLTCSAPACDDGVQNGDETDLDCGNSCGPTCDTGEGCDDGADCINDVCDPLTLTCAPPLTVDAEPACSEFSGVPVPLTATAAGGTGAYTYAWTPAAGLDDATSPTPNASPAGFETYTVTVDDGVNTAQDTATVVNASPFNLENNCTLYQGDFLAGTPPASIAYSVGGTVACELENNDFGLHLCEGVVFESVSLQGQLTVTDDEGDDDIIGLVWGAQNNSNFYSLTWKRQQQTFFGCPVPAGIVVKRVEAPDFASLGGDDVYCPSDTADSTFLLGPAGTTTAGWVEGEIYEVTIDFTPTGSDVTIVQQSDGTTVAAFTVTDTTFTSGFFGSTTISQTNACVGPLNASCL
jgi:hypothetical protein